MQYDRRQLTEYAFDGVFYDYKTDDSVPLDEQVVEEVEILRTKCDIQQTTALGNAGFLASSYTIFYPLPYKDSADDCGDTMIDDTTFSDVLVKRGMYFRGMMYGYEVNGKVIGVAPSMLGGVACQIKDLDE